MKTVLLGIFLCFPAWGTLFDRLQGSFNDARLPEAAAIKGFWAGNCVHWNQPDGIWPSFYGYQETPFATHYYYTDSGLDSYRYFHYTPQILRQDPALRPFWETLELLPVGVAKGSLVNYFYWPGLPRLIREARYISSEGKSWVILKVSASDYPESTPYTMCYYGKHLSSPNVLPPPQTPPVIPNPIISETVLLGETGPLANQSFKLKNLKAEEVFSHLVLVNKGTSAIRVKNLTLNTGKTSIGFDTSFVLEPNVPLELSIGMKTKILDLSFMVSGSTQNVIISGGNLKSDDAS